MRPSRDRPFVWVVIHRFGEDQIRIVAMFQKKKAAAEFIEGVQLASGLPLEWYEEGFSRWDDTWQITRYTLGELWSLPQSKD